MEAREDDTVAAIGSKLDAADKAVDAVLSAARDIAQGEVGMSTFSTACLALKEIASGLIPWTKPTANRESNEIGSSDDVAHSDDFRSMRWFGITYSFTPNQAAVMKVLYEHWVKGVPEIGQETLLLAIDPEAPPDRLSMVFRNHPAWMKVIISGRSKGSYRLVDGNKKI